MFSLAQRKNNIKIKSVIKIISASQALFHRLLIFPTDLNMWKIDLTDFIKCSDVLPNQGSFFLIFEVDIFILQFKSISLA